MIVAIVLWAEVSSISLLPETITFVPLPLENVGLGLLEGLLELDGHQGLSVHQLVELLVDGDDVVPAELTVIQYLVVYLEPAPHLGGYRFIELPAILDVHSLAASDVFLAHFVLHQF